MRMKSLLLSWHGMHEHIASTLLAITVSMRALEMLSDIYASILNDDVIDLGLGENTDGKATHACMYLAA